jgi:hypothetical protein
MGLFSYDITKTLGVYQQPGVGTAYPELRAQLFATLQQTARIDWLPARWLEDVRRVYDADPGALVIVGAASVSGKRQSNAPDWIDTEAKETVWNAINKAMLAAVVKYAREQQEAGRAELDALNRNAAFWNFAYTSAVVAAAPAALAIGAAKGVAEGAIDAGSAIGNYTGRLFGGTAKGFATGLGVWGWMALIVLVGGGGAALWFFRKPLGKALGFTPAGRAAKVAGVL